MEASTTLSQLFTSTLINYIQYIGLFFGLLLIPMKIFFGDFFKKL